MIEKQLYGKWLVPRSTDKLQVGNFSITYGSTQKENSYFWLWFPEHHIWCGSTLHKYFLYLVSPSRYSKHVLIQLINLPRNRDPIVTFRTCFVSRKRTGWKKACYRSDRAAAEFVDCVGRAMKEDFVKDIKRSILFYFGWREYWCKYPWELVVWAKKGWMQNIQSI